MVAAVLLVPAGASAEWRPANAEVAAAAADPRIAAVLAEVDRMDAALIAEDHAAFASALADELAVNNPRNSVSPRSEVTQLNVAGHISYASYVRTIEYAGLRGDMVLLMGEERVVPRRPAGPATELRRRFTDLWRLEGERWVLTARQASIVPAE